MKGFGSGLGLLLAITAAGCGGSVILVDTGDSRSVASCGDSCSSSQVQGSCASTCDKIASLDCLGTTPDPSCATDCANLPSMFPSCASASTDVLRCIETVQPTCGSAGTIFPGCAAQEQALSDCVTDAGAPSTSGGTVTSPPIAGSSSSGGTGNSCAPATVCPKIPRPASMNGVACSGGGGGGPGGPIMSQSSCQDLSGNVWQASCVGTSCTCTFNGGLACSCTMSSAAGCLSCCPGTN
jgi:hypothetical protein